MHSAMENDDLNYF